MKRILFILLCLGLILGITVSCSHTDDPEEHKFQEGNTLLSRLATGELSGVLSRTQFAQYERQAGKSEWREIESNPTGIIGMAVRVYVPNPIIFQNGECMVEFMSHIPNAPLQFSMLLYGYWETYCEKMECQYRIFIKVPFEYLKDQNTLRLGRLTYQVGLEDSEKFELANYHEDGYGYMNTKFTGIYLPNVSWNINPDLMLVYDSYEQMHDDIVRRLKEAFGEEGDISALWPAHPNIKFEELEKEMAEMSYECPYWFAPKPAWY